MASNTQINGLYFTVFSFNGGCFYVIGTGRTCIILQNFMGKFFSGYNNKHGLEPKIEYYYDFSGFYAVYRSMSAILPKIVINVLASLI